MTATWLPDSAAIGCGDSPDGWNASSCRKRFLLSALSSSERGETRERKETFFFGGTVANFWDGDFLELHGPNYRTGAMSDAAALWPWWTNPNRMAATTAAQRSAAKVDMEGWHAAGQTRRVSVQERAVDRAHLAHMTRLSAVCGTPAFSRACLLVRSTRGRANGSRAGGIGANGSGATSAAYAQALRRCPRPRSKPRCSRYGVGRLRGSFGHVDKIPGGGPNHCFHPGCDRIAHGLPSSWSGTCRWTPSLETRLNVSDTYCLRSMTPWAKETELNLSVVESTPNSRPPLLASTPPPAPAPIPPATPPAAHPRTLPPTPLPIPLP